MFDAFDDDADDVWTPGIERRFWRVARDLRRGRVNKYLRYFDDAIGFFREVLGVEPWEAADGTENSQAGLIRAVTVCDRVACRSGHKIGKSITAVGLALWFILTRKDARVLLTAPTFHQVKNILWRELKKIFRERGLAKKLGAELPLDPSTGLRLPDGNEIIGISTKAKENLAGISGSNLFFVVDEASGFPDDLWEVLSSGNAAGGAKIFCISNPTRTAGWFYDLFRRKLSGWMLFGISSEATPNVVKGEKLIPGLCTAAFITEMRERCGANWSLHPIYMVRILGQFPAQGANSVIPAYLLERAAMRWKPQPEKLDLPLSLGVDVARYGDDNSVIQAVRGHYAYQPQGFVGLDGNQLAAEVVKAATQLRLGSERIRVNVDGIGVGASVVDALKTAKAVREGWMYVVDMNVGEAPDVKFDEKLHYNNLRSQLWFGAAEWMKHSDAAIPEHDELQQELLAAVYAFDLKNRIAVEKKDLMRAVLERSPDYADALCLAVYAGKRGRWVVMESEAETSHSDRTAGGWDDDFGRDDGGGGGIYGIQRQDAQPLCAASEANTGRHDEGDCAAGAGLRAERTATERGGWPHANEARSAHARRRPGQRGGVLHAGRRDGGARGALSQRARHAEAGRERRADERGSGHGLGRRQGARRCVREARAAPWFSSAHQRHDGWHCQGSVVHGDRMGPVGQDVGASRVQVALASALRIRQRHDGGAAPALVRQPGRR
jgi:hypothetical protein